MSEVRASIDIGSNSVLLLVAELDPFRELVKLSEVTGLGRGLDRTGAFGEGPLRDTWQALESYRKICLEHGVAPEKIIATATEASRVASNASEFYARVKRELGIEVKIISGRQEAALTTKGILFNSSFDTPEVFVMDIGGASTELIKVSAQTLQIAHSVSLKVGAVRSSDWLNAGSFEQEFSRVLGGFHDIEKYRCGRLHCVAGTMTSLGNMYLGNKTFREDEVHGLLMNFEDLAELYQRYQNFTPAQFLAEFPFLGKRAEAMRGGLVLSYRLLTYLGIQQIKISTYGLRYGTLLEGKVSDDTFI